MVELQNYCHKLINELINELNNNGLTKTEINKMK